VSKGNTWVVGPDGSRMSIDTAQKKDATRAAALAPPVAAPQAAPAPVEPPRPVIGKRGPGRPRKYPLPE